LFEIKDDAADEIVSPEQIPDRGNSKGQTDFPSVIVDGEIRTMNNQIQYPMGKDGQGDD